MRQGCCFRKPRVVTNGLLFSSIFVGLKLSLSVYFSLKPASIASAVHQIIVLYMLTTLLSQGFKLLYEGKNTACMVNMVIVVSGIFPTKTFDAFIS